MDLTPSQFFRRLGRLKAADRYLIAFSGGLDSTVLLHLCADMACQASRVHFKAVHIHHGLQADADAWAVHCEQACLALGMAFQLICVDAVAQPGESREEAARNARYRALQGAMAAGDVLLTGQHLEDQAETVLLQLFRGAGLAGLAAMPSVSVLGEGWLVRPLLDFPRAAIESYARKRGLTWIEDPSNRDLGFDRNFVRHRVMPLLKGRWPAIDKSLQRTASHCAEAQQRLETLAWDLCRIARHPRRGTLLVDSLRRFSDSDQRLVLRHWLRDQGARMPSAAVLRRVTAEVLPARADSDLIVHWGEGEIRRFRGELFLLPRLPSVDADRRCTWDGVSPLSLPFGAGVLEAGPAPGVGIATGPWRQSPLSVGFRQGGEICRMPGRKGRHSLRNIFQELAVPPWVRERIPLIYIGDDLAAVGDLLVFEPYLQRGGADAIALHWSGPYGCSRLDG